MYTHGGNIDEIKKRFCPDRADILDFSSNINPLGPPQEVKKILTHSFKNIVNYPQPDSKGARRSLSRYLGIPQENLLITNGSIEAIYLVGRLLGQKESLIITPTFSEYERAVRANKGRCLYIQENGACGQAYKQIPKIDALFICNPNNPTAKVLSCEELLPLAGKCQAGNVLLIIDEAFIDFLPDPEKISLLKYRRRFSNVIIIRSLTKFFALAGLRVGYIVAHRKLIGRLSNFSFPWAVNSLAQQTLSRVIFNAAYIKKSRHFIAKEKDFLFNKLARIESIRPYYPSVNFILCKISRDNITSHRLFVKLAKKGIFIRDCSNFRGLTNRYFRLGVKTRIANLRLIKELNNTLR